MILVTGGAGFIGTHLCSELLKAGQSVRSIDIQDPKNPVEGVEYIKGDIRDAAKMKEVIRGAEAVYHMAAIVSVPQCQEEPIEGYRTNLLGTCEVLEAITDEMSTTNKKIRIVFSGSSAVYGKNGEKERPINETQVANQPLSLYAAQKLGSEHLIRNYMENRKVPAVIFRYFNVYGPYQDPSSPYSGVISIFSTRVGSGKGLNLNAGGFQTRDFVSVHDVARALVLALKLPLEKCDGRPMNLGTGQAVSIKGLAHMMMAVAGKNVPLTDTPPREGDVPYSLADISRARETLSWNPQVQLKEGLAELAKMLSEESK